MTTYTIERMLSKNAGDAREWAVCRHYGVERVKHDSEAYDKNSDCNAGDKHISVKASAFTLMSGGRCEGLEDFDSIWNLYERKTHSNTFAYVTADFTVYEMNISEFKMFVYTFGRTERESEKNGGQVKIRLRKESLKMLAWLAAKAAA